MLPPVRCFSCGKVLGSLYKEYTQLIQANYSEKDALDALGLERLCCRRMVLSCPVIIDKIRAYTAQHK